MSTRRKPLRATIVGIAAFAALAVLSGTAIYFTVSNRTFDAANEYHAVFTEVSGLRTNAEVQVAGVTVGRVTGLELDDQHRVDVRFTLSKDVPISTASTAVIRYKDLLGRRTLEILPGADADASALGVGDRIPVDRTRSALDLDQLYNGFSPLFEGLRPDEVNDLAESLVSVMQGQAANLEGLMAHAGSLTNTVADRDELVGRLIADLNGVLSSIGRHRGETETGLRRLQSLVSGLARDRAPLGAALEEIAGATVRIAGLVRDIRPSVRGDIHEVRRLSRVINQDQKELSTLLANTPGFEALIGRVGMYQSAFQFYLCGVQLRFARPGGAVTTPMVASQEERCRY